MLGNQALKCSKSLLFVAESHRKMSLKLPSFSKAKNLYLEFTRDLQTFNAWTDLSNCSEIGRGTYGSVLQATFQNDGKVVVKKLLQSSRPDEKRRFFKGAKLLQSLTHINIAQFKRLCVELPAIMMEFLAFNFEHFCPYEHRAQQVSNLQDFLGYLDENNAVEAFPPFLYQKIARYVSDGLQYLHNIGVYHRDLKTSNILVSNMHYSDKNSASVLASFNVELIICKLTDFGENRSQEIQTMLLGNTKTTNVAQGTPAFMAPGTHTMEEVEEEDLKRIDMWAYGR